jgi:hypothetical protein
MVLGYPVVSNNGCKEITSAANLDWHLVNMDPFFYAKLGNEHVERGLQNTHNLSLSHNWPISVGEI